MLNVKKYYYNTNTNTYDNTSTLADVNTLPGGVTINNSYMAHPWVSLFTSGSNYVGFAILNISTDAGSWYFNGLQRNTDEYVVLRKLIGTQYRYYWIKARVNNITVGSDLLEVKVLNGKYQMNSIVTGI